MGNISKALYGVAIISGVMWLTIKQCNKRTPSDACTGSTMFWIAIGAAIFGLIVHMNENPEVAAKLVQYGV